MTHKCEFPEATFVSGDNRLFTYPLGDGKESLLTFTTMEVAAQSLEGGCGIGSIDDHTTIKKVSPHHWITIVEEIGPTLAEIIIVFKVDGENLFTCSIPTLEFLDEARRRCKAELN